MRFITMLCAVAGAASATLGAGPDNNVEWNGLGHVSWQDLRPVVPMRSDTFGVEFQAYRGDLTSARVIQDVGGALTYHAATVIAQRGPYDIWRADLPGTSADDLGYVIEVTDGTDTDYLGASGAQDALPAGDRFELDFATLAHAPEGATPVDGGVVFKVWSPTRSSCRVRGEFNGWGTSDSLTKVGEHFIGFVAGAQTGQMYKYFFNNSVWNSDPRARRVNPTNNYNAFIHDPVSYQWVNDDFIADPLESMVIYQLHVGTFAGRNDPMGPTSNPSGYRDVGDRAAHLAELGVNAVMVNPISEFPGDFSGGYSPVSMFAWEWALGEPDDLKYMIDMLHGEGIAVILDTVWNHFSVSDNFMWNYDGTQLYFDSPAQDTPWGAQADFDNPGVFRYFTESVDYTFGEFRMDGYRQDAVMYMTDSALTTQWGSGQDLMREMNAIIDDRYADAVSIAEIYIDSSWVQYGIHFDAQYHNEFKEALRSAVFGAGFGGIDMSRVAGAIDGTNGVSGTQVLNYFELHDDAWPLNGHQRAVKQIDTTSPHDDLYARGRTTLAHALVLLSKGVPAILQGTEWLEDDGWEEFKIDWSHKTTYSEIFDYYKAIIGLRTSEPALFANASTIVHHVNEGMDVIAFERYEIGGKSFVVVANLSNFDRDNYRIGLPRSGTWGVAINNQAIEYGGPGAGTSGTFQADAVSYDGKSQSYALDIPARGLLVLEHDPSTACSPADLNGDGLLNLADVSAFIAAFQLGDSSADLNDDGLINLADVTAFIAAFQAGCS